MNIKINNSQNKALTFKGTKVPDIDNLKDIYKFVNCGLNGLQSNLLDSIKGKSPSVVKQIQDFEFVPDFPAGKKILNVVKDFFLMPVGIIDSIAKKFPDSGLDNLQFLKNYRDYTLLQNEINSYHGLEENGAKFIKEAIKKGLKLPQGACDGSSACADFCNRIKDRFNRKLNEQMSYGVADYDTKKERFATRLISGFTAAFFLGNDFYNKAIQKGKTVEEAKREQHLKQGQEIKENICEGIAQFAVLACFSKMVNKSVWAPAIISTLIGLVSRIISRKTSGMPLGRIEAPEQKTIKTPDINNFIEKVKANEIQGLFENKEPEKEKTKRKKPLLSIQNILLFCAFSVFGGYALRYGKKHTQIGKMISDALKKHQDEFDAKTLKEIMADKDSLYKMCGLLRENGEQKLAISITDKIIDKINTEKVLLGTDYRTTKILGVEVKTRELRSLISAPFRFVKELVAYPYKIVSKLEKAIKNSQMKAKGIELPKKRELLQDNYDIRNLYERFLDYERKFGDDPKKLSEEFGKYVKGMRVMSNNNITSSSTDNSKIAVLAQTLGTLTGMWFNMNDEYNSSIRNGATKSEAQKDARLRGINKFFRMTVQVIISGSLNSLFFKQYNNSIAKAGAVVAASTILTDTASRVLTGMPNKKMTKEELDNYEKGHQRGAAAKYYELIDKLAS